MANQYGNLGILYQKRGELDRAEEMHKKSLAIDEKLGRQEGMASDYGNLGVFYQSRGEPDRAEEMHRKSLAIEENLGLQEGMASQYRNLGFLYQTRGDSYRAEEMLKKALVLFKAVGAAPQVKEAQAWLDGLNESRARAMRDPPGRAAGSACLANFSKPRHHPRHPILADVGVGSSRR